MKQIFRSSALVVAAAVLFSGCAAKNGEAPNDAQNTKSGVLIGTLVGAALGAITSKHHKGGQRR